MKDIKHYGVTANGLTVETAAIQNAIDLVAKEGGGILMFPSGFYQTGTLVLRSKVHLHFEKGATLLGSRNFADYKSDIKMFVDAVENERGRCLIFAENIEDFSLSGEGVIDGRGAAFPESHPQFLQRPFLLRAVSCKNFVIKDLTFKNSAAWNLHFLGCEGGEVSGVKIISRVNHNNDGIDIDSCQNFKITDCFVDTGDDGICLKSTIPRGCENINVTGCTVSSRWAAFKIGTESMGDFKSISVRDCTFFDTEGCGIKIVPVDGAQVEDVTISDIRMINTTGPIFIANGSRMRTYFNGDKSANLLSQIRRVTIKNVNIEAVDAEGFLLNGEMWGNARACVVISGTPEHSLEEIVLENIVLSMPGGGTALEASKSDIPEMGKRYPEFHNFGVLPASGFFIRHADKVELRNCRVSLRAPDARELIKCVDVKEFMEHQN